MKLINAALAEKNVSLKDLSPELQQEVASLQELIVKYNEACDIYEDEDDEDKEAEKKLDEMEDYIAITEQRLADKIKGKVNADGGAVEKSEKKGSGGLGWLLLGGVVLVATVGAVNLFKKR